MAKRALHIKLLFSFFLLTNVWRADVVFSQSLKDSSQLLPAAQVISRTRPDKLSPAQFLRIKKGDALNNLSVADAIRYFSGVQLKDYGGVGGLKTINIRNMGTHHAGIFFDGIQLGNAQNGQIDLGRFSLDNLEEISLYNSQKTELLQPARNYSSASAIFLTNRKPVLKNSTKNQYRAAFKTGSFGLINPSFQWDHQLTDSISSLLSAELVQAHGRYRFRYKMLRTDGTPAYDTTAIRQNGDISAVRTEWALYGNIKNGEWRTRVYNYYSERGLPGYIASNLFKHSQRQWDHNFFVQSSLKKKVTEKHHLLFNLKYAYDYTRFLDDDTTTLYIHNKYRQHEIYASVAQELSITPNWKAGLATDYIYNSMTANLRGFSYPTRHTAIVSLSSAWHLKRFSLQANLLGTVIRNHVKTNIPASPNDLLTPAIHASVQPFRTNDFRVRAFYKEIFRVPTFNDLYYTLIGNAFLKPEFTRQYNLGFTYNKDFTSKRLLNLDLRADVYYNEVTDKIVAVPTANPFRWTMMNLGFVKIKGVEVLTASTWSISSQLRANLKLNYTFQQARDYSHENDSFYGGQIAYAPKHSFSSVLQLNYKKWQCNYSFLYTGDRYSQKANIPRNYMPAWYTSDVGIARLWNLQNKTLTSSVELNNLLNQHYDVVLNYPMPGRSIRINLSLNF